MKQVKVNTAIMSNLIKRFVMKISGFAFLLIGISIQGSAQELEWENNFGGSDEDLPRSVIQTSDGGFAVAGYSRSSDGDIETNNGVEDYWILKLDKTGALQWKQSFGGSDKDIANSIVQTSDGGFAVAGYSESTDGDVVGNKGKTDFWVIKLDSKGVLKWEKNLGGSLNDRIWSIIQTSDGGFALAGYSESSGGDVGGNKGGRDCWIVKLNNTGAIQWKKNLGGSADDEARAIVQTSNGGFAIAGYSESDDGDVDGNYGSGDYWIVKLNNSGKIQWEKHLGGSSNDYAWSIVQANDGGFTVAGYSSSSDVDVGGNNGGLDYWAVKLDKSGTLEWEKNLGGSSGDRAYALTHTSNGGFALAGFSRSSDGDVGGNEKFKDYWVVKLDEKGALQWERNLGGNLDDRAWSITNTSDGGLVVAGESSSQDGDVGGTNGREDYWLVKLDDQNGNQTGIRRNNQNGHISLYPNPAQNKLKVQTQGPAKTYTLHTLTGQKAKSGKLISRKKTHTLDISHLSPGIYLLKIQGDEAVRTKKVVLE